MATNYMTVIEHEMENLNARLWRIRQAIDSNKKTLGCPKLDAAIMEYRYKVTKHLLDVLFMQHYVWECADEKEEEEWDRNPPKPEELVKDFSFPVDEQMAEGQYREQLEWCDQLEGPELEYMDIYEPMNWWKDLPEKRRKQFKVEAAKALKHLRSRISESENKGQK